MFQSGFSIAQDSDSVREVPSLDKEAQEFICENNTVSSEAESICLKDKVAVERVAVCSLYTSNEVAEAICLKNKTLSYENVLECFIGTDTLIEQICLVGSETSSRVVDNFKITEGDSSAIIKEIENITTEMETLLSEYEVRFNILEGQFEFYND